MHLDPHALSAKDCYKFAIGSILPRPIAWVSTIDSNGVPNLAPYSFFTVASSNPLMLTFAPQYAGGAREAKDTLANVRAVPEFVVNLVDMATADAMNQTAVGLPHGESEFEHAGLTPVPGQTISVPRVGEAPIAFECTLDQIVEVGSGALVIGAVQSIYVRDDVYVDGYVVRDALQPVGRLAGNEYARVTDVFELIRR